MYRLTVLYGHPNDPEEFDEYFHNVHLPLAENFPGVKRVTSGRCEPSEGIKPPFYMIVGLYTETRDDMDHLLASPEGRKAAADLANFATGGTTLLRHYEEPI